MHNNVRSHLTVGVAVLGAGAMALSSVQPLPEHIALAQERAVSNLAVNLAATIDPITPWVQTLQTSFDNIKQLAAFYVEKPFPILQTVGANIGTYVTELTNGNAGKIPQQIQNNIKTFFQAPWWNTAGELIPNGTFAKQYISDTKIASALRLSQRGIYALLPGFLTPEQTDQLGPLLEFTATPYSGQLAGLISPVLGSLVQLTRSLSAVGELFTNGDALGAINELINIPAKTTNAFLNGLGYLDLTSIAGGLLPPEIKTIGLNLGGWISPPVPLNGSFVKPVAEPTQFTGGTFFDAVAATASALGIQVTTPGLPQSWAGSVIGLGQFMGQQLLVTPPPPASAAALAPKAAAAEAPALAEPPAVPADTETTPSVEISSETAESEPVDAPEPVASTPPADTAPSAVTDTSAKAHRGGGAGGANDNGGRSGAHGHRGAS